MSDSMAENREEKAQVNDLSEGKVTQGNFDTPEVSVLNPEESKQEEGCKCGMKKSGPPSYVYAIGRIALVIPSESLKREIALVKGAEKISPTISDEAALYQLLTGEKRNKYRYLAREVCWIFTVRNAETYVIVPADLQDYERIVEVLNYPSRSISDTIIQDPIIDIIVGEKGPVSPPGLCGPYTLPLVRVDNLETILIRDMKQRLEEVAGEEYDDHKPPLRVNKDQFLDSVRDIFNRFLQRAESEGADPQSRALTFLAAHSLSAYTEPAIIQAEQGAKLEDIIPKPVKMVGSHSIVEVIFFFTTGIRNEMYSIDVDVSGKFPYLMGPFTRYYNVQSTMIA